jgi:hypothetical protein
MIVGAAEELRRYSVDNIIAERRVMHDVPC